MSTTPKNPWPQVRVSIQYMDPTWAAKLLATNLEHQRRISSANLYKITASLKEGQFVLNGQSVIVDEDGKLLDGQHRLQACVNTGIGFWTVFVNNIPSEYFKYMDCGKARTFPDVLKTMARGNTAQLSATIARLAEYKRNPASVGSNTTFAHSELLKVLDECPGADEALRMCQTCSNIISASQLAWLIYLVREKHPEKVERFLRLMASGQETSKTSPIFHMRQRVLNSRAEGFHAPLREMCALLIKVWNAHASDSPMKALRYQSGEPFPELDL